MIGFKFINEWFNSLRERHNIKRRIAFLEEILHSWPLYPSQKMTVLRRIAELRDKLLGLKS